MPDLLELEWTGEETEGRTEDDLCVAFAGAWSSNYGGHEVAFAQDGRLLACGGGPTPETALHSCCSKLPRKPRRGRPRFFLRSPH
ncbi:MAG: hypothetical protein AAFZ18_25875, partial [Myxococcota bacterium]